MKIYENILELVGNTPIVRLNKLVDSNFANVFAKLEYFNPMGSVKDRIGLSMIEAAEQAGKIKPGDTLVEPTSGNTGIALAMVASVKGYSLVLTMPESMSLERQSILSALGASVVLVKPEDGQGMRGALNKADQLAKENGWFQLRQFDNQANPDAHRQNTAREIISSMKRIDAFVAGVGTGGTISGVAEVLKRRFRQIQIIAVEPETSHVLTGGVAAPHVIQGIGAGFKPNVLNMDVIDEVITVSDEDAVALAKELMRQEGLFAGISSGAAAYAAFQVAKRLGRSKKVLTMFPDTAQRYLSAELFGGDKRV